MRQLHAILTSAALLLAGCGSSTEPVRPTALEIISGSGQTGTVGAALASPIAVRVLDARGVAVPRVSVTFTVTAGGGTVSAAATATDAQGRAQAHWTLGDAGTQQSVRATLGASGGLAVSFTATVPIAAVTVTPAALALQSLGETAPLAAIATDSAGTTITSVAFAWSSSASGTVAVSAAGVATAVANGSATITAATGGVSSAPVTATVAQVPVSLTLSPPFRVLSPGTTLTVAPAAADARGNALAPSGFATHSSNAAVATVSGLTATAQGVGVANVVVTAGPRADSSRIAVVPVDGFAMLLSRSADSVALHAVPGSTLVLALWMIRPPSGTGDLGAVTGTVQWDPSRLQIQSSAAVQSGWTWLENAANASTGSLAFSSFSVTGTAGSFVLARVTFTVLSTASASATLITPLVSTAGTAEGTNITGKVQPVGTSVSTP